MSKYIKYILQLFCLLLFIVFTIYFLLPFAQKSADSHSVTNDFLTILFFVLSILIFVLLIYKISKKTSICQYRNFDFIFCHISIFLV